MGEACKMWKPRGKASLMETSVGEIGDFACHPRFCPLVVERTSILPQSNNNIHVSTALAVAMGAQYSTGTLSPDWKGWLEDIGSLEILRSIYQDYRALVSSRIGNDGFFVTAEDFRQVFVPCALVQPLMCHCTLLL